MLKRKPLKWVTRAFAINSNHGVVWYGDIRDNLQDACNDLEKWRDSNTVEKGGQCGVTTIALRPSYFPDSCFEVTEG